MMHPSCLLKVEQFIKDEDDEVKNIIRNLCVLDPTDCRINDLIKIHLPFEEEGCLPDCRIAKLTFHNFRTYPKTEYGLSFRDRLQNRVSSLVLVGQNGSGKSTLYTALEKIYTGVSSYASLMSENENEYLTFAFRQKLSAEERVWQLDYLLADGTERILKMDDKERTPLAVPAFFCSDVDVNKMKSQTSIFEWILEQMGFVKIEDMIKRVGQLLQQQEKLREHFKDDTTLPSSFYEDLMYAVWDYDKKRDEKELLANIDVHLNEDATHHLFSEKWDELKAMQESHVSSDEEGEGGLVSAVTVGRTISLAEIEQQKKNLHHLYLKLYSIVNGKVGKKWKIEALINLKNEQIDVENLEKETSPLDNEDTIARHVKSLEKVQRILLDFQIRTVEDFIKKYGNYVKKIMTDFSNHGETYEFINIGDKEKMSFEIHVKLKGNYFTHPHEYFNEFRFKLYCITMKMSIAFYWMLENQKSVPIVIDDVFNANDFENSIKLEHYAYFMKKIYNDMVLCKGLGKELQIILLSHDGLVTKSFCRGYKGLSYADIANMKMEKFPVIEGRIFCLEEIDEYYEMQKKEGSISQEDNKIKSIYQCLR